MAEIPGCVETRNTQPGNRNAYDTDPKGNLVVCDGTVPSYRPLEITPGIRPPVARSAPPVETPEEGKPTEEPKSQPVQPLPATAPGTINIDIELPCPPPDAIPLGAKNKSQTAVIIGYELVDGKCEAQYELLPVPVIVGNYLPGAPVVLTTAAIAATATTSAIIVKPLGDKLLKLIKPIVKKVIKKIKQKLGKKVTVESVSQRRQFQRSLRK